MRQLFASWAAAWIGSIGGIFFGTVLAGLAGILAGGYIAGELGAAFGGFGLPLLGMLAWIASNEAFGIACERKRRTLDKSAFSGMDFGPTYYIIWETDGNIHSRGWLPKMDTHH